MKTLVLTLMFIQISIGIPKNMQKKIDNEILSVFNIESFLAKPIIIDNDMIENLLVPFDDDNFYKIEQSEELIGYYYFGKALGKTDEFDFVVIFDKQFVIKKIKVLAYREDYGMEIGSKRWLKQFKELTMGDFVKFQKDIKSISGATISARSMTKAVNDLLQSLTILQNKNQI